MADPGKGRVSAIVVGLADRIEFVIVTAGAAERHTQKSLAGRVDDFIQGIGPNLGGLSRVLIVNAVVRARYEKGRSDLYIGISLAEYIARQMLPHEGIEGLVLVDRTNDVVAKGPEILNDPILLEADAFAEAYDIQPMAPPTLSIARRCQKSVDQALIGLGIGVRRKRLHFLRRRRQAGQIVSRSSNERSTVRLWIHGETRLLQGRFDVSINRSLRGLRQGSIGPPGLIRLGRLLQDKRFRPGRSRIDPSRQGIHLFFRQRLAVLRHVRSLALVQRHRYPVQHAIRRIAWDQNIVACSQDRFSRRHREVALHDVRVVTAQAFPLQNRGDFGLEVDRPCSLS